jgi:hypothetical protein
MKPFSTKRLTLKQLIDIDQGRIDRSHSVEGKVVEVFNTIKEDTLLSKFLKFFGKLYFLKVLKYEVKSDSGSKYTVLLELSPNIDYNRLLENKVKVFCSCPDFMYRASYLLSKSGDLFLNKATKKHLEVALTIVPTKLLPTPCCKHIYACIDDLNTHYKKYNLTT